MSDQCDTCKYWKEMMDNDPNHIWGECRRYPPSSPGTANPPPCTKNDWWCGEWEAITP